VTTEPAGRAAAAHIADQATSDPAPLVPIPVAADHITTDHITTDHITTDHITTDHVTTDHVTAREIADFLRHLAELRRDDPGERAAFLARKTELFTRLAADTPPTTAPEGSTP
jgi:hypothetical protein